MTFGPLGATPPSSADANPLPSAGATLPATILVTKLEPRALLNPRDFLQVRGRVVNRGAGELHGLTVRLRRGDKLSTRGELAVADAIPPGDERPVGAPVPATKPDVAGGGTATFDLRVRVSELHLGTIGVYPLELEARAQLGGTEGTSTVATVQTYLPWFPDGPPRGRIRLAWIWPLVDVPHQGPREALLDPTLASSFSRGGRLDRLIRAASDGQRGGCDPPPEAPAGRPPPGSVAPCRGDSVPITYAIDPDLLFTATAMTRPYQLTTSGSTRRVEDTTPARSWLTGVRAAVSGADVLSLPYADPDVAALTAAETGLGDEVALLRGLGETVTTQVLHRPVSTVVWPPAGRLSRQAVEALTSGGATAVAVEPAALALGGPPARGPATPDAHAGRLPTSTGDPAILTLDPVLSGLLTPTGVYAGDRLVEQRWLAETAMISAEAPSISRTILVAPDRRAELSAAVGADALRDTGRLPWLCPVPLANVAAGTETCPGETRPAAAALPPVQLATPAPGDRTLPAAEVAEALSLRRASSQFTDEVLAEPTSPDVVLTAARLTRARARGESSAWRTNPMTGFRLLDLLRGDLTDLRGKVHLQIGSRPVTLTSSTGVISVNVVNELQQPVRVGVILDARNRARLSTRGTPLAAVRPESAAQINVKVTAQTSGTFPVIAQLVDQNGNGFGPQVRLIVRSTQYGRVALAVTGVAAGVLLAAAGIRIARRALRGRPA